MFLDSHHTYVNQMLFEYSQSLAEFNVIKLLFTEGQANEKTKRS